MTLVDFNVILAKETIAATLDNSSDLLSVLVVNFGCRPTVWQKASQTTILTPRNIALHLIGIPSVLWDYFRLILSAWRCTTFLTKAVFVFFDVSDFLPILPDDIGTRTKQKPTWRSQ